MKKGGRRYPFLIIILIILCVYFKCTAMPIYNGRLSIDINNTTFSEISNAMLYYETANVMVSLPDIRPLERVIVLAPVNISNKHMNTRVFVDYNGEKKEILGEYHTMTESEYNADYAQYARMKIKKKRFIVAEKGLFDFGSYFNIKPYFRVIDMDKIDK